MRIEDEMVRRDYARKRLISRRIREAREAAGLSQCRVAEMMGLHRPSVSGVEAGKRDVTAVEIAKFAVILDVSVAWLVGEDRGVRR